MYTVLPFTSVFIYASAWPGSLILTAVHYLSTLKQRARHTVVVSVNTLPFPPNDVYNFLRFAVNIGRVRRPHCSQELTRGRPIAEQ